MGRGLGLRRWMLRLMLMMLLGMVLNRTVAEARRSKPWAERRVQSGLKGSARRCGLRWRGGLMLKSRRWGRTKEVVRGRSG